MKDFIRGNNNNELLPSFSNHSFRIISFPDMLTEFPLLIVSSSLCSKQLAECLNVATLYTSSLKPGKEVSEMSARKACPNVEINLKNCGCTYVTCDKRGKCCECIRYHLERNELPGCVFPPEIEKTYDRSIKKFVQVYSRRFPATS